MRLKYKNKGAGYMKRRTFRMENRVEVIGIDHGWSGMKTGSALYSRG